MITQDQLIVLLIGFYGGVIFTMICCALGLFEDKDDC